jgi:hypothetical protein
MRKLRLNDDAWTVHYGGHGHSEASSNFNAPITRHGAVFTRERDGKELRESVSSPEVERLDEAELLRALQRALDREAGTLEE